MTVTPEDEVLGTLETVEEDAEGVYSSPMYQTRYGSREDAGEPDMDHRQEYEPPTERTKTRRPSSASLG
eukprot:CAMPEP_0114268448 /NCGR_PEP_ID=MMETSP0058-20121206/25954_1 /TAXON_ID=36894 /ORGANISM="Pyramimonas parkeae, CCMP726" /LENGTH=68 /DNA_ID=CAMNT_0001386607 /DNA_START=66 /DNA_END=269 /DNA_ORIENTATION=+